MEVDERFEAAKGDFFWAPRDVIITERPELKYSSCARDEKLFNSVVRARAQTRGDRAEARLRGGARASRSLEPLVFKRAELKRALRRGA